MLRTHVCALLTLLAAPSLAVSATVHFANHTQTCSSCWDNGFYHADFNNDGYEDLAYVVSPPMGGNSTFVVKFSNKDGAYSSPVSYGIPNYNGSTDSIAGLALGDFYHDGSMDIVALSVDSGKAYIFRNNGSGAFSQTGSFQYVAGGGSVSASSVVAADFNHDGNLDLAIVSSASQLQVWFGDGKGGFTSGPAEQVNGLGIAVGDFDGDGKADLLNYNDPARISDAYVYYGDGAGHFPDEVTLSMPSGYAAYSVGDVNSDGMSDVMAVDTTVSKSRVYVFYGDAVRKLASRTSMLTGRCVAGSAQTADLDGNGLNDLIIEEEDCNNPNAGALYVDVLTRNPNSSYNPDQTIYWAQKASDGNIYSLSQTPIVLRADQDSSPDLLVQQCADSQCYTHHNTTMLNTTSGNFNSCSAPWAAEGITVCSPLSGQAASSPVRFQIAAAGPVPMRDVEVWIDGSKRAEQIDGYSYYTFLDQSVTLSPGSHTVTVFGAGWDQTLVRKSFTVSVQ